VVERLRAKQTGIAVKPKRRQKKVFLQYVLLKDVNDSIQHAEELYELTRDLPCKVNLIRFNSHEGSPLI